MYYKKNGFTLTELLIVIAIIALITAISTASYSRIATAGRDNRRVSDVMSIQQALELYHRDEGFYPAALTPGQELLGSTTNNVYLAKVPVAPTPADGICSEAANNYTYNFISDDRYTLNYCLGRETSKVTAGKRCATPTGISYGTDCGVAGDEFSCPDIPVVQYEGGPYNNMGTTKVTPGPNTYYRTVKIGDQCWLRDNLNVGTMITGTTNQTNNSVVEKNCLSDSLANCDTSGGLYQWNEAMQYSMTESAQGICPTGWHIPTDAEQNTLDQYLTDPGQTCDAGRNGTGCANAGTKLLAGGTSHFEGLIAGYRETNGTTAGGWGLFWSSTISGQNAWDRYLSPSSVPVGRQTQIQARGFSVRCLRNY